MNFFPFFLNFSKQKSLKIFLKNSWIFYRTSYIIYWLFLT